MAVLYENDHFVVEQDSVHAKNGRPIHFLVVTRLDSHVEGSETFMLELLTPFYLAAFQFVRKYLEDIFHTTTSNLIAEVPADTTSIFIGQWLFIPRYEGDTDDPVGGVRGLHPDPLRKNYKTSPYYTDGGGLTPLGRRVILRQQ